MKTHLKGMPVPKEWFDFNPTGDGYVEPVMVFNVDTVATMRDGVRTLYCAHKKDSGDCLIEVESGVDCNIDTKGMHIICATMEDFEK